jgi:hypothetical protein
MRTFINSRAMAMTLALETMDHEFRHARPRARRRLRRTRDENAADRTGR